MKKIAVVTATRAEYGLLSPVIQELRRYEREDFTVALVVTGTHLSEDYRKTITEIENDGVRIDYKIRISVQSSTALDISMNQAEVLVKFTKLFLAEQFNAITLLGDRYETLAIAIAATNTHIPIFHLCGGDVTEGAIDDCIRHSITKMSYLHFVSNEDSRRRVLQLGEGPERVFNFGSPGIDNILKNATMSKQEALQSIGLFDCKYAICTYHPVTLKNENVDMQLDGFLDVIKRMPDMHFIITKSNADQGGSRINEILDEAETKFSNIHVYASLGVKRYLSLMRHADFVLGNSSSGILEAPAFHIPTVNIGNRQKGRLRTASIIDCEDDSDSIFAAIKVAKSDEFRTACAQAVNPYGEGGAAIRIARKCVEVIRERIDLQKKFYNLE